MYLATRNDNRMKTSYMHIFSQKKGNNKKNEYILLFHFFSFVDLYAAGHNVTKLASMCKLKSGRLACEVTDSCLQFWGGMGFTNEVGPFD